MDQTSRTSPRAWMLLLLPLAVLGSLVAGLLAEQGRAEGVVR